MFERTTRLLAAVALLGVAGCGDSVTVLDEASLTVLLTDAATDYIESAEVDIGAVELIPADDGGHIGLSEDGTDGFVDLLDLRHETTMILAAASIPAGSYAQLRLIVEGARVELKEGYEFNDGSTEKELFVPSGAQTGIKLNLTAADGDGEDAPLEIVDDETLVLDFDVAQSFVIQGNPETSAGIMDVIFTPTIRIVRQEVAATISGTVSAQMLGIPIEGLTVTAELEDDGMLEEFQSQTATAPTGADGTYTIHFAVPGTYTVTVTAPGGFTTDPASRSVEVGESESVTGVDFTIVPG